MSMSLHTKKKLRMASMLAVAFIASKGGVVAAANVTVQPQCPTSISPGAPLTVELTLTNTTQTVTDVYDGTSITSSTGTPFTIATSGLIAHLGNLNIIGPFVIPLALTLQPQPTITINQSNPPTTPAPLQSITTSGYLYVAFPTTASPGTFTHIVIQVLDKANKTLGTGSCAIEVI